MTTEHLNPVSLTDSQGYNATQMTIDHENPVWDYTNTRITTFLQEIIKTGLMSLHFIL
jgi:hypothetical protein